jgi:hypothetical protein
MTKKAFEILESRHEKFSSISRKKNRDTNLESHTESLQNQIDLCFQNVFPDYNMRKMQKELEGNS